jgi:hypothetical protein
VRAAAFVVLAAVALAGFFAWRSQLVRVERQGSNPVPLVLLPADRRDAATFDASLPMVPVGVQRLAPGGEPLVIHYWAPWERHSGVQATALDSLRRLLPPGSMQVAVVCFDPYPSVSRYVARLRLRVPVLLDLQHALSNRLPCPSIPWTYVVDRQGRIAVSQGGEVDWLAPATRAVLDSLAGERREPAPPARALPS